MSRLRPSSWIPQFLDVTSTQRKRDYRGTSGELNVIFEFLLLLLGSIRALPWHGLRFFANYCVIVEIEDERSLLSFIFFECPVGHLCLGKWMLKISHNFSWIEFTFEAPSSTRCANISSMSKSRFMVKWRAPRINGDGSRTTVIRPDAVRASGLEFRSFYTSAPI